MDVKRAYRFRFSPPPEQQPLLAKTFGCARFAYHRMLRIRTDVRFHEQKSTHAARNVLVAGLAA